MQRKPVLRSEDAACDERSVADTGVEGVLEAAPGACERGRGIALPVRDTACIGKREISANESRAGEYRLAGILGVDCLVSAEQVRLLVPPLYIFGEGAGRAK